MTDQPEALRVAHELECRALINEISLDDDFVMELDAARLLREQHAEIERLREQLRLANIDAQNQMAENEALRADAERYGWLREKSSKKLDFYSGEPKWMVSREQGGMGQNFFGDGIDAAIDAAIAEERKP